MRRENSLGTPTMMKGSASFSSLSSLSSPSSNPNMSQPNLLIEEFDLVVGADGINSQTRNLVFGPDIQFKKYLNVGYMCFMVDLVNDANDMDPAITGEKISLEHCKILSKKVKEGIESSHTVSFLLDKGRYMTISRNKNRCYVSCAFTLDEMASQSEESNEGNTESSKKDKEKRTSTSGSSSGSSDEDKDKSSASSSSGSRKLYTRQNKLDIDVVKRKQFLVEKFADVQHLFPQLIQLLGNSNSIYYDDLAQIHIDKWHKGRIVLLGDSCQALTPLSGKGASMALVGAKTLADELKRVLVQHAKMDGVDYIRDIPVEKLLNHQDMPYLKDALESYERKMLDRIKEIQRKTIREGDFFLTTSAFKQFIRNSTLKYMPKKLFLKLSKKDAQSNEDLQSSKP
ncbi:predicted protein [Naegleria gruberi]|uniref:Predicted protein n=1 Tax=Naegleria gruberi TaxID=5762 RepID=D2VKT1_NAEGR|nr:uncharacterized protein NAEGRDRAFT_69502 [Naegleria gruberi]EFC42650.1 predicted protein [Naegleria gruberi]|eukprot:XP_002675394.1 predicted protein [Naegleria gruberi strain NEG-M]